MGRPFKRHFPFVCDECVNKGFWKFLAYEDHMKQVHGITVEKQRKEKAKKGNPLPK